MNETWLAIYNLLKPTNDTGDNDVEIPLKIKLIFGTGNNLGIDTPLPIFQEMNSEWQNIIASTIESNQLLSGDKMVKLESYQPGKSYTFNVSVDSSFTDFNNNKSLPIEVFLIDSNLALSAAISVVAFVAGFGFGSLNLYIPKFIAYMKRNGWVKNLPPTGGSFDITPGNSHNLVHFCVHTANDGGQGAVITEFNSTTNTFTLGGY